MSDTRRFVPVDEWEDSRQLLGMHGERIAMAFLTSCGWSVEAHRFKLGRHDLDLVVRKGRTVAFVEVKTRRSNICGTALEAVSRRKQRDIARVASCGSSGMDVPRTSTGLIWWRSTTSGAPHRPLSMYLMPGGRGSLGLMWPILSH